MFFKSLIYPKKKGIKLGEIIIIPYDESENINKNKNYFYERNKQKFNKTPYINNIKNNEDIFCDMV
jgi:hypothetical protein